MQLRKIFTLAFALFALPVIVTAQDAKGEDTEVELHKTTKKADDYFNAKEYSTAIDLYKKAMSKEKRQRGCLQFQQYISMARVLYVLK